MIARPPRTIPVPDRVADLAAYQLPAPVWAAVVEAAGACQLYAASRGPQYTGARQLLEARLRAANKVLGAHNPGLIVGWGDLPGLGGAR